MTTIDVAAKLFNLFIFGGLTLITFVVTISPYLLTGVAAASKEPAEDVLQKLFPLAIIGITGLTLEFFR